MKDILIKNIVVDNKNNDIYRIPIKDLPINCPQIVNLSQSYIRGCRYHFNIIDSRLDGIDFPCVGIKIPEIKGKGSIRYTDYPGLKLIKSFEININGKSILKLSGFDIFSSYFSPNVYKDDTIVGHREDYCNYKKGKHLDYTIFNQLDLFIPIFTQFDKSPPHSILRIPKNNRVEFVVEIGQLTDIISYDREFASESLSLIEKIIPEVKLLVRVYNIQSSYQIEDKYIEENNFSHIRDEYYSVNPKEEFFTNTFKKITEIGWFCKTSQFNNMYFISHPGYNATEKDYIISFRNRIFPDLIRISESFENFKDEYPGGSVFVNIENNTSYKFDNLNYCKIIIRNVPKNNKIWFHTNVLEFNRGGRSDNYNISKKFKYILGDYIKEENRIIPLEIIDELNIEDVSIPVDLWDHTYNTAGKDLRSYKSKKYDVLIYEPYIFGLDFVSKNIGFEKDTTVKAGPSERIIENNKYNFYLPYFGYNHFRNYYFLEKYKYPCIGNANFNIANILLNQPSSLDFNKEKNILNCSVEVKWKDFDENHPLKLVKKSLNVFIKKVKKLRYTKDCIEVIE